MINKDVLKTNSEVYEDALKYGLLDIYQSLCSVMNNKDNHIDTAPYLRDFGFNEENMIVRRKHLKLRSCKVFSVQASSYHYCIPRLNVGFEMYERVELGVFECKDDCSNSVLKYCDWEWDGRRSEDCGVYVLPYISVKDLLLAIKEEGGIYEE